MSLSISYLDEFKKSLEIVYGDEECFIQDDNHFIIGINEYLPKNITDRMCHIEYAELYGKPLDQQEKEHYTQQVQYIDKLRSKCS